MIFTQLSLGTPLSVIASPFLLSLRAERGNLGEVPDCFVVRQLTDFLAMTEGGHCEPRSIVIASPSPPVILSVAKNLKRLRTGSAKQSQETQTAKMQNDRARMKNRRYEADGY